MKRTKRKLKTIALGVLVAAGMLLPCAASAQSMFGSGSGSSGSDGFFKSSGGDNRTSSDMGLNLSNQQFGSGGYNLSNQTFGDAPVPLGSGLLVMTLAGAGYAVLRRRKNSL